ncbi:hypothetical protein EDEG_02987 [Edhazardia aedis USNM 41457]|uniref:CAAX prenyl protease n=1 Tax=Edhazardia aedis (strain USNM 41457) TaxID=1003232 RepID=J8ZSJ0_EDHAE|nr:hypothetical protein EDEG_02987 [Edhazardia aedis USNM 41457]|eukprot:EJW02613.1 hypothetical protein EDEG_02987 [Edhazardia aedis USNM 41457]
MIVNAIIYGNIFATCLEAFVNIRQLLKLISLKPSSKTKKIISTEEEFHKMRKYNTEKLLFSLLKLSATLFECIFLVKNNILLESYAILSSKLGVNNNLLQIIYLMLFIFHTMLLNLPFDLISTFYIESKYGFNKTTLPLFFTDILKQTVLTFIIVPPLLSLVLYLIDIFPNNFYIYVYILVVSVQLILMLIFPSIIHPLFNKFENLEEGNLKNSIINLAKEVGFKPSKILKMDGSKRSHHSNAYFIGIFKEKRIVLFDTLINQCENNQILAILCHEFGHWHYSHIWKKIIHCFINLFIYCYLFNKFTKNGTLFSNLLAKFNSKSFYLISSHTDFTPIQKFPMILKLLYFAFALTFINPLENLIDNFISRVFERQADKFAVKKGYAEELKTGLINIHVKNYSNIVPDKLYSIYHHSHPTLFERLELIDNEVAKIK